MNNPSVAPRGSRSGLIVVFGLAIVFFTFLGLLLKYSGGRERDSSKPLAREFFVLPITLRVRTQPTTKAPVLSKVSRGEKLEVVEEKGAWARVKTSDGIVGWVDRSGLEAANERELRISRSETIRKLPPLEGEVEKGVPLYAGPGIFYPQVGELTPDTTVKVFTRDHDFYAIEYGGEIAYAEIDAIDVSPAVNAPELEVAASEDEGESFPIPERPLPEPETSIPTDQPEPAFETSRVFPVVPEGGTEPEIIDRTMPRYPGSARRAGVEGVVVLRAIIRKDGRPDNIQILRDLSHGLGDAARDAVESWIFRPATYRGEPIDVYYTVTVNYRLRAQ